MGIVTEESVKTKEILAKYITFQVGGEADYFVTPNTGDELKEVIAVCKKYKKPYYIIGKGSNLLIGDKGYRGVIIKLSRAFYTMTVLERESDTYVKLAKKYSNLQSHTMYVVDVKAGMSLGKMATFLLGQELEGFEFGAGIPGTVGGAVAMNAGAYGGEIKDCLLEATVLTPDGIKITLSNQELQFGYRKSIIQEKDYIVLEAKFAFEKGKKEEILAKIKEFNQKRKEKQPLEYPSAGSTFKRPEGYFAGKLIMDAGLRGYRVGNACVSEKHCGFVVNLGGATAQDIVMVIQDVQRIVEEKFHVTLETEVKFLGEF